MSTHTHTHTHTYTHTHTHVHTHTHTHTHAHTHTRTHTHMGHDKLCIKQQMAWAIWWWYNTTEAYVCTYTYFSFSYGCKQHSINSCSHKTTSVGSIQTLEMSSCECSTPARFSSATSCSMSLSSLRVVLE